MGLDAGDHRVYDLLNDKMYIVAPNQRKYVWTKNNWKELLDDIDLVRQEKTTDHFIGSIVLKKEASKDGIRNCFSIIDGQQRISTLTIMLCAVAQIFAEHEEKEYFDGFRKALFVTDKKDQPYPIVSAQANMSISKLVETLFASAKAHFENKKDAISLLSAQELLKSANAPTAIHDCFMCFYEWFNAKVGTDMELLSQYKDIIDEIRYIDIVADEDEDAYTVFEILNARGQPLTDFELLRNFLLKYSPASKKNSTKTKIKKIEELLGEDIEVFLKHYVTHKYGEKTNKNDKRPYKIIAKIEKERPIELLDDLMLKAGYYKKIRTCKGCTAVEKKIFSFFKRRRQQQFRPLVLSMMHQKDLGNLSLEQYAMYLEFLYEFFICYHIVGEQTSNKIEDVVYGYSQKIECAFSNQVLEKFKKAMVKRMPDKDNFYNSVKKIRFSNYWKAYSDNKKRENATVVFEIIERELGYQGDFSNCNIEHCMPDSKSEKNAHIGNLMLLEKQINDRCKNKPLEDKLELYHESALVLPGQMYENQPVELDFEERSSWLAGLLYSYITKIREDEAVPV